MIVLYVAHDSEDNDQMCPGSTVCLSIVDKVEEGLINIQDCDILRESKQLPSWLNGSPILVDDKEGIPHRGKEAVKHLREIAQENPRKLKKSQRKDKGGEETDDLNSAFTLDVQPMKESSSSKVTEQDLQKYMEARNSSAAGQSAKTAIVQ